jgi:hypothetical protein
VKLFRRAKDGGPESTVTGYWLIEAKKLFSIALLKFEDGSRDSYHTHAFNSVSWVLSGAVQEHTLDGTCDEYHPSWLPVLTLKERFHRVVSKGTTWVLTFRGPWDDTWREYSPRASRFSTLTHGRREV